MNNYHVERKMSEKKDYKLLKGLIGLLIQEYGISCILGLIVSHIRISSSDRAAQSGQWDKSATLFDLANEIEQAQFIYDDKNRP